MAEESEGGWIMTIKSPFEIRADQIIEQQWSQIPDFTREEIRELQDKGIAGDQTATQLLSPLWDRYVKPSIDEFYRSEEGQKMWIQHCFIHGYLPLGGVK